MVAKEEYLRAVDRWAARLGVAPTRVPRPQSTLIKGRKPPYRRKVALKIGCDTRQRGASSRTVSAAVLLLQRFTRMQLSRATGSQMLVVCVGVSLGIRKPINASAGSRSWWSSRRDARRSALAMTVFFEHRLGPRRHDSRSRGSKNTTIWPTPNACFTEFHFLFRKRRSEDSSRQLRSSVRSCLSTRASSGRTTAPAEVVPKTGPARAGVAAAGRRG